ncbi:MAG TPA: HNH endonuclease family protein, partial [Ktedonobacteraceae bacterium]|nr:HNH endonuclease family protein [Ktedonobacteraceae bacterium]
KYIQNENGIKNLSTLPKTVLSESQRNIRDNTLAFMQRLQHLSEKERVRLGKFLVTNCFVVVVSTADFDTAYRIFSVLNDRGRNLTYADILKAQIIGDIPAEKEEEYANKWEEIEVLLGSENFQQLLTLIRILSSETRIRKNLLEEFHTYVYPNGQLKMTAQQLIDRLLQPYGYTLHTIITADYKDSQYACEIEELLRWLNRLPHKEWLPAALQYWGRNRDNPDLLLRFLQDLDRLSVGLLLLNTSYSRRSERYYQLQTAIKQGKNVYASGSPLQLSDDEQRDIYKALNGNLYINVNASLCKYILLRLDALLSDGSARYDFPTISVEHVLPQKPLANSEWLKRFPGDARNRYLHQLGNLVLLSKQKNHDANNYDFAKKKAVYFSNRQGVSPFALTSQVLREPEWTPAVIQKRQHELVSKLASHWNLKSPTIQKSPSLHVVKGA